MMSLITFGLFTQVSNSRPHDTLVLHELAGHIINCKSVDIKNLVYLGLYDSISFGHNNIIVME